MAVDHLSLYQLTIEAGTRFGDMAARGRLRGLPAPGLAADLFQATREICAAAGMPAYEVSNHARPGSESRHNLVYWRYGDYVGVGPGAHGRIAIDGVRHATRQEKVPETWVSRAMREGHATVESLPVGRDDAVTEALMMGLAGKCPGRKTVWWAGIFRQHTWRAYHIR